MGTKDTADKSSENMLFKIAGAVAQHFLKLNPLFVKDIIASLEVEIPKPTGAAWDKWADNLVTSGFVDTDTANLLKGVKEFNFPLNILAYTIIPLMIMLRDMSASLDIYGLDRQYEAQKKTTPHPAPIDNLVRSMIIDPKRSNENREQLKRQGFDDTQIDNIILSYYRTVEEGTIRINFLRKNITESVMYERMRELGYTDTRIKEIVLTWKVLPGPGDLLEMVAKEAFEPDIYNKLGLASEFPTEQVKWLEEQGISQAWAMKYWIAHWNEPSIGQGFEMLHRGVIDADDLDILFKAVEIPPYWRDKLTKIAYNPYTRVDVRRMHDMGVIGDDELKQAYLDIGYDSDKADKMVAFTIRFNAGAEKELTRSAILESYEENLISRGDATALLESQDYSEDLADYYLTLTDFNREKSIQTDQINNIADKYLLGMIEISSARVELNNMGLLGNKIDSLIETWELKKYQYESLPSKTDLDGFLIKGIITEGEYYGYMNRLGFENITIVMYIKDLASEIASPGRAPSRTDLENWLKSGIIDQDTWEKEMSALGYSDIHISNYLKEV